MTEPTMPGVDGADARNEPVPGVIERHSDDDLRRAARIAGLRGFVVPTLDRIDRRRNELLLVTIGVLLALSIGVVALSILDDGMMWFGEGSIPGAVRIGLIAIIAAYGVYIIDKERSLRRLSKFVINEQVLSAALANRLKELSALSAAGKAVSSTLELDEVLAIILGAVSELLEADEGSVMLVEGEELVVAAGTGHPRLYVGARQQLHDGIGGYVARTREPLLLEGGRHGDDLIEGGPGEIRSAMSVPLEVRSELLGVLNLNVRTGERRFSEYELHALSLFGEHAANAIQHGRTMRRERELRMHIAEADRLRTEMVSSMIHDLKSPLTSILGSARLLKERWEDLEETRRKDFLETVGRQGERLLQQIERLLDAARSQAQHLPLDPVPLDLSSLVEEIAEEHGSAYGRTIGVVALRPKVQALADAEAVRQVISNLLENAMRHTPETASVRVEIDSDGNTVVLRVVDDGPGIPKDSLAKLFTPFQRGDGGPGTGLGLFVVANLSRAIGGRVEVASQVGSGTTFTVRMPAYPPSG